MIHLWKQSITGHSVGDSESFMETINNWTFSINIPGNLRDTIALRKRAIVYHVYTLNKITEQRRISEL